MSTTIALMWQRIVIHLIFCSIDFPHDIRSSLSKSLFPVRSYLGPIWKTYAELHVNPILTDDLPHFSLKFSRIVCCLS